MNICLFTTVCIDKNTTEHASYVSAGSPAIYIGKLFNQLPECKMNVITSYGPDFNQYVSGFNILPLQPNSESTLMYENIYTDGIRTLKAHNRDKAFEVKLNSSIIDILRQADIVCFAPLLPIYTKEYIQSILQNLKQDALKVILPQGFYRKFDSDDNVQVREFIEEKDLLPLMDIIIVSEKDSHDMLNEAKKWATNSNVISIVTLGEKGAVCFKGNEEIIFPVNAVPQNEIIDSVGSGEIFTAAFVYKYKETGNLKEAGSFANAVARQCLFYKSSEIKIDFSKII
jgi:sugar/nucleoside kinase (ribokinase family)